MNNCSANGNATAGSRLYDVIKGESFTPTLVRFII